MSPCMEFTRHTSQPLPSHTPPYPGDPHGTPPTQARGPSWHAPHPSQGTPMARPPPKPGDPHGTPPTQARGPSWHAPPPEPGDPYGMPPTQARGPSWHTPHLSQGTLVVRPPPEPGDPHGAPPHLSSWHVGSLVPRFFAWEGPGYEARHVGEEELFT